MKILENNDFIRKTCPHCQSVLGIHCRDIRYNDVPLLIRAECGVCGRVIDLSLKDIPMHWRYIIFADDDM